MLKKLRGKNQKGFTLVELLVVIAIIGVLAVVAVPALFKNINKAKVADLESDYSAIKSAALSYYTDNNAVPTTMTGDTGLTDHMDSVPEKSSLGDGIYTLEESILSTDDSSESLSLNIGVGERICENEEDKTHGKSCYKIVDGVTLTKEQLIKLVNDLGENMVYICNGDSDTFEAMTKETIKEEEIAKYIGKECRIKLVLIKNTKL